MKNLTLHSRLSITGFYGFLLLALAPSPASAFQVCNHSVERVLGAVAQRWICATDAVTGAPVECESSQGWQRLEIDQCTGQYPGGRITYVYGEGSGGSIWDGKGPGTSAFCTTNAAFNFSAMDGNGAVVNPYACAAAGGTMRNFRLITGAVDIFTFSGGMPVAAVVPAVVPSPTVIPAPPHPESPGTPTFPPAVTSASDFRFLSLAWSPNGYWSTLSRNNLADAESGALSSCQTASGQTCTLAVTLSAASYRCLSILRDRNRNTNIIYGTGISVDAAFDAGMDVCRSHAFDCKLEHNVCNDIP